MNAAATALRTFARCAFAAWLTICLIAGLPASVQAAETLDNTINTQQVPDSSFLYDTNIYDLLHADASSDGRTVQITGEVVGDAIRDAGNPAKTWITLYSKDDEQIGTPAGKESREGSISVLIDTDELDVIDSYGRYGVVGTTLQVQGVFHLSCESHGGETDIHADVVKVVAAGQSKPDAFNINAFLPGIGMVVVGAGITVLYYWRREKMR